MKKTEVPKSRNMLLNSKISIVVCLNYKINTSLPFSEIMFKLSGILKCLLLTSQLPGTLLNNKNRTRIIWCTVLKAQSHEKTDEIRQWDVSLGPNYESLLVFKISLSLNASLTS
jgi:hypothetical protein